MFRKNIYVKNNLSPFKISRTKIDLFFDCKRCFYVDQKFGIKRPHGTALVINNYIVNKFKKTLKSLEKLEQLYLKLIDFAAWFTALNHEKINQWINPFRESKFT